MPQLAFLLLLLRLLRLLLLLVLLLLLGRLTLLRPGIDDLHHVFRLGSNAPVHAVTALPPRLLVAACPAEGCRHVGQHAHHLVEEMRMVGINSAYVKVVLRTATSDIRMRI